jgi:hypothetical protein
VSKRDVPKPHDLDTYLDWLEKTHEVEISMRTRNHYDSVVAKLKADFTSSSFWQSLLKNLVNFDERYRLRTGYPLLAQQPAALVETKPYDSFLLKTFRQNVLDNAQWPSAPPGGWILPRRRSYDTDRSNSRHVHDHLSGAHRRNLRERVPA